MTAEGAIVIIVCLWTENPTSIPSWFQLEVWGSFPFPFPFPLIISRASAETELLVCVSLPI